MASVIQIATSGLQAAAQRLSVSANNVANATTSRPVRAGRGDFDDAFAPQRARPESRAGGGADSVLSTVESESVIAPDNSSPAGNVSFPNINFLTEYLQQKQALVAYKANASVIRAQRELDRTLFDIET